MTFINASSFGFVLAFFCVVGCADRSNERDGRDKTHDEAPPENELLRGVIIGHLPVQGERRSYQIYVPDASPGLKPVLLGFTGPEKSLTVHLGSKAIKLARQEKLIFVCPHAVDSVVDSNGPQVSVEGWSYRLTEQNNKNVAFIDALINELCRRYPIDRSRVYLIGSGDGGNFVFRFVSEHSEKVAACAIEWHWENLPRDMSRLATFVQRQTAGDIRALFILHHEDEKESDLTLPMDALPSLWIEHWHLRKLQNGENRLAGIPLRQESWGNDKSHIEIDSVPKGSAPSAVQWIDRLALEWRFLSKWAKRDPDGPSK